MTETTANQRPSEEKRPVRALVLTGYGLNCDYETDFSLKCAGAESHKVHINEMISGRADGTEISLSDYHILVFGGGFSWADDHGAGVLMATKLKRHLGHQIQRFIAEGKLILGICNGFQCLVNIGLLPGFDKEYSERRLALISNDSGNFVDDWVSLRVNPKSPCIFSKGLDLVDLPVRHGQGKLYASDKTIQRLLDGNQVVLQYADEEGRPAGGKWPLNPNGSLSDIAGICDPTGRVFGLMPHPEAFNHYTNHPAWTLKRQPNGEAALTAQEGLGVQVFRNAVEYIKAAME